MSLSLGVDKSSYDGHVDWAAAFARRLVFATVRASDGLNSDALHVSEAAAAQAAGVHVSPYHYYIPGQGVAAQAEKFLSSTPGGDLPPMLDLEDYSSTRGYAGIWTAEIKPWLDMVQAATGVQPWIYSSPAYIQSYLSGDTGASEYPFVIANYDVNAPLIPKPLTPVNVIGWQFGDGRDAHYYGFKDALGCALYVVWDIEQYVKAWTSGANPTPPPTPPTTYSKGVTQSNVKVRSAAGTQYSNIFPWMILKGTTVAVIDVLNNGADVWVEIAQGQWCAAVYGGQTLIALE
jgi:hypothetical protein